MNLKELEEKLKRESYLVTPTSYGSVISYVKENKNDPNWDKRPPQEHEAWESWVDNAQYDQGVDGGLLS